MQQEQARAVANVLLTAAAVGAAYYVIRTPALRRLAWGLAVTALTTTLPNWFRREVQQAWAESGRRTL